jgi:hypothetical protein
MKAPKGAMRQASRRLSNVRLRGSHFIGQV